MGLELRGVRGLRRFRAVVYNIYILSLTPEPGKNISKLTRGPIPLPPVAEPSLIFFAKTAVDQPKHSEAARLLSQTKSSYRRNYEIPNFRPIGLQDL